MSQVPHARSHQSGITLIVSLIMLVLLTMLTLTTFKLGHSGLELADNAQQRQQVQNAAQATIDTLIGATAFISHPTSALDNGNCPSALNTPVNSTCIDLYGDGKTIVNVALSPAPTCVQAAAIVLSQLDLTNAEDLGCSLGIEQNFGIASASSAGSLCADSVWEINVVATESVSGARQLLTEGVKVRVSTDAIASSCP